MTYELTPDIALADVAFTAKGDTLQELFQSCAQAVIDNLANPESVQPKKKITIEKTAKNIDRLLFDILEDIIYYKDKKSIVYHDVSVEVDEKKLWAKATLHADTIQPEEQELLHDIKAITMHYWRVEKTKKGWIANVVLDI